MKIIGIGEKNKYICEVSHEELEKFLNLYYNKLSTLKHGDTIDLGKGYDFHIKIEDALKKTKEFIKSNSDIISAITSGLLIFNPSPPGESPPIEQ